MRRPSIGHHVGRVGSLAPLRPRRQAAWCGARDNRESVGWARVRGPTSAVYGWDCGDRRPEVAKARSPEDVLCGWSLLSCAYHRRRGHFGLRQVNGTGDDRRRIPRLADTRGSRHRSRATEKERRRRRVIPGRQPDVSPLLPHLSILGSLEQLRRLDIPCAAPRRSASLRRARRAIPLPSRWIHLRRDRTQNPCFWAAPLLGAAIIGSSAPPELRDRSDDRGHKREDNQRPREQRTHANSENRQGQTGDTPAL